MADSKYETIIRNLHKENEFQVNLVLSKATLCITNFNYVIFLFSLNLVHWIPKSGAILHSMFFFVFFFIRPNTIQTLIIFQEASMQHGFWHGNKDTSRCGTNHSVNPDFISDIISQHDIGPYDPISIYWIKKATTTDIKHPLLSH